MHGGLLLSRVVVLPGGLREYTKQTAQAQVLTLQKSSGSRSRLKACQLARHWGLSTGDDTMVRERDISPLTGLSEAEAAVRLKGEGRNELPSSKPRRSEEHTSELQSPLNLVCRLLLEKK